MNIKVRQTRIYLLVENENIIQFFLENNEKDASVTCFHIARKVTCNFQYLRDGNFVFAATWSRRLFTVAVDSNVRFRFALIGQLLSLW